MAMMENYFNATFRFFYRLKEKRGNNQHEILIIIFNTVLKRTKNNRFLVRMMLSVMLITIMELPVKYK